MNQHKNNAIIIASILLLSLFSGCGGGGDSKTMTTTESQSNLTEYNLLVTQARSNLTTARTLAASSSCNESSECERLTHRASINACHPLNAGLIYSTTSGNAPNIVASFENYKNLSTKAVAIEPPAAPGTYVTCVTSSIEIPPACISQICQ